MEFSYKLSEAEFLGSSKIATQSPKRRSARLLSFAYWVALFLVVWSALLIGMMLEWSDFTGDKLAHIPFLHIITASIMPSLIAFWLIPLSLRVMMRWPNQKLRREHFRTDPGCQADTTVIITKESVAFRSATGSSESIWDCYRTWGERNGILVLITRSGIRKILKISGLLEAEQAELRTILASVLPKK